MLETVTPEIFSGARSRPPHPISKARQSHSGIVLIYSILFQVGLLSLGYPLWLNSLPTPLTRYSAQDSPASDSCYSNDSFRASFLKELPCLYEARLCPLSTRPYS